MDSSDKNTLNYFTKLIMFSHNLLQRRDKITVNIYVCMHVYIDIYAHVVCRHNVYRQNVGRHNIEHTKCCWQNAEQTNCRQTKCMWSHACKTLKRLIRNIPFTLTCSDYSPPILKKNIQPLNFVVVGGDRNKIKFNI